jgi:hypothetical protein
MTFNEAREDNADDLMTVEEVFVDHSRMPQVGFAQLLHPHL